MLMEHRCRKAVGQSPGRTQLHCRGGDDSCFLLPVFLTLTNVLVCCVCCMRYVRLVVYVCMCTCVDALCPLAVTRWSQVRRKERISSGVWRSAKSEVLPQNDTRCMHTRTHTHAHTHTHTHTHTHLNTDTGRRRVRFENARVARAAPRV